MRSESYVYDVTGGYFLTGIPSLELYIESGDQRAYLGGWSSNEWVLADDEDEEVWGHDVRTVRVVTRRELVRGLVAFVTDLSNEATNRNEAAYERSVSDYYGGDGPQTQTQAERDVAMARDELADFHSYPRRGYSPGDAAEAKRLQAVLDRALDAAGES
jgi:hypothetical protein